MNGYGSAGSLFAGLMQGLMQGQQAQSEMQQKKDLLKLEQDKIKLQEREGQLRSATDLKTAMMQAQTASQGQQLQAETSRYATDIGRTTAQEGDAAAMARLSEQLKMQKEISKLDREQQVKLADMQVKQDPKLQIIAQLTSKAGGGMSYREAANLVLGSKEDDMSTQLIRAYITSSAMTGQFDLDQLKSVMDFAKQYSSAPKKKISVAEALEAATKNKGKSTLKK